MGLVRQVHACLSPFHQGSEEPEFQQGHDREDDEDRQHDEEGVVDDRIDDRVRHGRWFARRGRVLMILSRFSILIRADSPHAVEQSGYTPRR